MENGPKFVLASLALAVVAIGGRFWMLYHHNQQVLHAPNAADATPDYTADQMVFRKQRHPAFLKDEHGLIGQPVWMAVGGQLDYYRDTNNHADYMKSAGTLDCAEELDIRSVFEQVAPANAAVRIPKGYRQVLLAFTLPKSTDPKALYAVPVGDYDNTGYNFLDDQLFYYDDPRQMYKQWGTDTWAHIDKHEVVTGMTENQAMMALGQVMQLHGDTEGDRSITFYRNGSPITVDFEKGKAVKVTQG